MTRGEVEQAVSNFETVRLVPYLAAVMPLMLLWVYLNLFSGGKLVKLIPFNFFRLFTYIKIIKIFWFFIEDIVTIIVKKEHSNRLGELFEKWDVKLLN